MVEKSIKRRVLETAASLIGGRRNLAGTLGVRSEELQAWLSGIKEPPTETFLRAVEVILDKLDRAK